MEVKQYPDKNGKWNKIEIEKANVFFEEQEEREQNIYNHWAKKWTRVYHNVFFYI